MVGVYFPFFGIQIHSTHQGPDHAHTLAGGIEEPGRQRNGRMPEGPSEAGFSRRTARRAEGAGTVDLDRPVSSWMRGRGYGPRYHMVLTVTSLVAPGNEQNKGTLTYFTTLFSI